MSDHGRGGSVGELQLVKKLTCRRPWWGSLGTKLVLIAGLLEAGDKDQTALAMMMRQVDNKARQRTAVSFEKGRGGSLRKKRRRIKSKQ
jgi:hypothetical protein